MLFSDNHCVGMKRFILLLSLVFVVLCVNAQTPAWTKKLPKAGNNTYMYVCESALAYSEADARNQAIARVFQTTANRLGQPVDAADVNAAVQSGTALEVISRQFNIPMNKVCEYVEKVSGGMFRVYVLCQVAVAGNITVIWETFNGCNDIHEYNNGVALLKSAFVPGLGQMGKRHYGEGIVTLTAEVALAGVGTACYLFSRRQLDIMRDSNVTYDDFSNAKKTYNSLRTTSYIAWGTAAAVYVFNLYRAFSISPKYKDGLSFAPAVLPANDGVAPGLQLTLKF